MNNLISAAVEWILAPRRRTLLGVLASIALLAASIAVAAYYLTKQD
jgi:hypothetical protein